MASDNYCTRSRLKRAKVAESEDRISELPSEVIAHILSFLPIKNAIRTSSLSSRWKFLWTSRTNFDFEDFDHLSKIDTKANYDQTLVSFRNFVHHVLHLCDDSKTIHRFILFCFRFDDISLINTWINFAVSRNVSEISLFVPPLFSGLHPSKPLPKCTLTCNNLVSLLLRTRFEIEIPASIGSFPHLKELFLAGDYPGDLKVTTRLVNMCPVLEKLLLSGEVIHDKPFSLDIFVPTLKSLTITLFVYHGISEHKIMIRTPKLQSLRITGDSVASYRVNCPSTIDEADIEVVYGHHHTYGYHERIIILSRLYLLLAAISKAKSLSLSAGTMSVLGSPYNDLPAFPSLRTLTLQDFRSFSMRPVFHFLEKSPNLEVLVLDPKLWNEESFVGFDEGPTWIPPDSVPGCLSRSLKTIRFENIKGQKDQLEFIKYLLENGHMLELFKISLCCDHCSGKEKREWKRRPKVCIRSFCCKKVVKELKRLVRVSHSCEVEVSACCDCFDMHASSIAKKILHISRQKDEELER